MASTAVPDIDELDAERLTGLLRAGPPARPGLRVRRVDSTPIGATTGFLGQLRRLVLHFDGPAEGAPARLVAKAPTHDPGGREVGRMLDVWAREHRFYAELAPTFGPLVPLCHANLADPAGDRWLLLLEDAGDSAAPSQAQGADVEQAGLALDAIAAVHRRCEGNRPTSWLPGFDRGPFSALQGAVVAAVEPFLSRFGDRLPAGGADLLRAFAPRLAAWAEGRTHGPLTLVHADYRLDNLVLGAEGRVVIVDWQTALLGRGEMDVASFLVTSLTVSARRTHEAALLARYAEARGHDVDQVREEYRQHLLWWAALYANNLSRIAPADAAGMVMFDQTVVRTFAAALDHDVGRLVPR